MPIWIVQATWTEDEADVTERWQVNAPTAHEAVREATMHIRFPPHHVEARQHSLARDKMPAFDLTPGQIRRIPPQ